MKELIHANHRILKTLEMGAVIISGTTAKLQLLRMTNDYKSFTVGTENNLSVGSNAFPIDKFISKINLTPDQAITAEKIEKHLAEVGEVWKITLNNKTNYFWFY